MLLLEHVSMVFLVFTDTANPAVSEFLQSLESFLSLASLLLVASMLLLATDKALCFYCMLLFATDKACASTVAACNR